MVKVKVYFFKPSGKWYATEEIEWIEHKDLLSKIGSFVLSHSIFKAGFNNYKGMWAICIDNPKGYPIMIEWVGKKQ